MELTSCSLCGLQYQQQLTVPFDIPTYLPPSDSVKILNRRTCKQCCLILANIQSYVEQAQIRFCNHNFKSHLFDYYLIDHAPQPKKSVQLLYATSSQIVQKRGSYNQNRPMHSKRLSMTQRSFNQETSQDDCIHPYISLVIDEILQKNYLTMMHFPKTLQFLIYLSASSAQKEAKSSEGFVLAEERHEKVKNIILYLTEKIHLSVEEIPYVLFVVNFLLCLMHPPKVVSIIVQLSNILIAYPQLLTWKSLIFEHERSNSQTPLSPATIDLRAILVPVDKLWAKIESIIDLGRRGEAILREGLIRISKIEVNVECKQYRKKLGESMKSMLSKKENMDLLDESQMSLLYLVKLQRNSFSLILKEVMEDEEQTRLQMVHMQHKFKMEKDEFIDKIVKLNNKIEILQENLKQLEENAKHIPENAQKEEGNLSMEKQIEEMRDTPMEIQLNSILTTTDLFNFNERHYFPKKEQEHTQYHSLTQKIIVEIQKMQETIERSSAKMKSIEQEKSRLLGIISRKQERLLAVILEKDTTIERYEQALWTMENGLQVTQGPLVNRIKYIMHIFASRQKNEALEVVGEVVKRSKQKDCQIY